MKKIWPILIALVLFCMAPAAAAKNSKTNPLTVYQFGQWSLCLLPSEYSKDLDVLYLWYGKEVKRVIEIYGDETNLPISIFGDISHRFSSDRLANFVRHNILEKPKQIEPFPGWNRLPIKTNHPERASHYITRLNGGIEIDFFGGYPILRVYANSPYIYAVDRDGKTVMHK